MHWTRDCASVSSKHHWPAPVMRDVGTLPMLRATIIINALLWLALGAFCTYGAVKDWGGGFIVVVAVFGAICILNGIACVLKLRVWRASSRVVGAAMILYGLDVLLLGHGEDVGGAAPFFTLVGGSLGLGIWSIALASSKAFGVPRSQPAASPNGGPTKRIGNSGADGGPPSVS